MSGWVRWLWHRMLGHNCLQASDGYYCAFCDKDWT